MNRNGDPKDIIILCTQTKFQVCWCSRFFCIVNWFEKSSSHVLIQGCLYFLYRKFSWHHFLEQLPITIFLLSLTQSSSLILTAYQLQASGSSSSSSTGGAPKSDSINVRYQSETPVAWFHEVLTLFSIALQLCQQLKDKITVLQQCLAEKEWLEW